jgi:hypothetical protein
MVDPAFRTVPATHSRYGDRQQASQESWFQATRDSDLLRQFGYLPGFQELLMVRQVHALEHGTVWVLSEQSANVQADFQADRTNPNHTSPNHASTSAPLLGGMSTDRGFYLYGQVSADHLWQAVHEARSRLVAGEWHLAVHPRCGTNLSVSMLLTAGLALGAHIMLPKNPLAQLMGLGVAATVATQLTPDLGSMAQQYLTTAIPFNIAIDRITSSRDRGGCPVHFVHLRWR